MVKKERKPLTKLQKDYHTAISAFYKKEGRPATYKEQAELMGFKYKQSAFQIARLIEPSGWVKFSGGKVIPL